MQRCSAAGPAEAGKCDGRWPLTARASSLAGSGARMCSPLCHSAPSPEAPEKNLHRSSPLPRPLWSGPCHRSLPTAVLRPPAWRSMPLLGSCTEKGRIEVSHPRTTASASWRCCWGGGAEGQPTASRMWIQCNGAARLGSSWASSSWASSLRTASQAGCFRYDLDCRPPGSAR